MNRRTLFWSLGLAAAVLVLVLLGAREDRRCLALALIGACDGDKVSISQKVEDGVTIVTITGPKKLLDRMEEVAAWRKTGRGGFQALGFYIAWGDEGPNPHQTHFSPLPQRPDDWSYLLTHVYAAPGTYQSRSDSGIWDRSTLRSATGATAPRSRSRGHLRPSRCR